MNSTKKLGIVLGSGGSRGVAHVGFLKALDEAGIKPDYISGSSMGAIVGALYASGIKPQEMKEKMLKLTPLSLVVPTLKRGSIFDTSKVKKVLKTYLGEKTFNELKIPFRCVATDLQTKQLVTFKSGLVIDAVVASATIPGLFSPTKTDGMVLVDGGVIERLPVKAVKEMGAEVVVAIDVLAGKNRLKNNKNFSCLQLLLATVDIMDETITEKKVKENAEIIDLLIKPELGTESPYSFKKIEYNFNQGYKVGKQYVNKIKELITIPSLKAGTKN